MTKRKDSYLIGDSRSYSQSALSVRIIERGFSEIPKPCVEIVSVEHPHRGISVYITPRHLLKLIFVLFWFLMRLENIDLLEGE